MKIKKAKHRYSTYEKKKFPFIFIMIAIPILQFLVFWLFVNLDSITLAFRDNVTGAFTLEHFSKLFTNMLNNPDGYNILTMIGRSFLLWVITNVVALPIGLFCTYVMYRKVWGHYAYRVVFSLPLIVGSVIWVGLISALCRGGNGAIVTLLKNMGVSLDAKALKTGLFSSEATGFTTLIIIFLITNMVGGGVIATSAFGRVPKELFEAGELDGVGFCRAFFHIALPCAWPTISTLLTVALCSILVVDGNVWLYTNGTGGENQSMATMGFYLYKLTVDISEQVSSASIPDYGYAAAVGIFISLVSVPIVLIGRKVLSKIVENVEV